MDVYQAYGGFLRLETSRPRRKPFSESSPLRRVLFPYRGMARKESDLLFGYEKIVVERTFLKSKALCAIALRLPWPGPFVGSDRNFARRIEQNRWRLSFSRIPVRR
jgi:hypothetical protein